MAIKSVSGKILNFVGTVVMVASMAACAPPAPTAAPTPAGNVTQAPATQVPATPTAVPELYLYATITGEQCNFPSCDKYVLRGARMSANYSLSDVNGNIRFLEISDSDRCSPKFSPEQNAALYGTGDKIRIHLAPGQEKDKIMQVCVKDIRKVYETPGEVLEAAFANGSYVAVIKKEYCDAYPGCDNGIEGTIDTNPVYLLGQNLDGVVVDRVVELRDANTCPGVPSFGQMTTSLGVGDTIEIKLSTSTGWSSNGLGWICPNEISLVEKAKGN